MRVHVLCIAACVLFSLKSKSLRISNERTARKIYNILASQKFVFTGSAAAAAVAAAATVQRVFCFFLLELSIRLLSVVSSAVSTTRVRVRYSQRRK